MDEWVDEMAYLHEMILGPRFRESVAVFNGASLIAQQVKNLPVMQEMQVRSLGWEDPLEEEIATDYNNLAWKIPWTEEPGWATVHGVTKSQT